MLFGKRLSWGGSRIGCHLIARIGLLFGAGWGALPSVAQEDGTERPSMIAVRPIQNLAGIAFVPGGTDWVTLESSVDLRYWTPVVQVAAQTSSALYVDVDAATFTNRFFRVRSPGLAIDEVLGLWEAAGLHSYSYRFERIAQLAPNITSALVTVRRGVKVITDVVSDGLPVSDPDPAFFPSIPQLFEELTRAKADGIRQVWVTWGTDHAIPARCTFDRRGGLSEASTALVQYRISGFTVLSVP